MNWPNGTLTLLTNSGVVDVVVGSNHPQIEGREIHLILYSNTLHKRAENDGTITSACVVVKNPTCTYTQYISI